MRPPIPPFIPKTGSEDDDCKKQWEDATKKCEEELEKDYPDPAYKPKGAPSNWSVRDCAKGFVDARCGGNPRA
jgi:hypothetical protein